MFAGLAWVVWLLWAVPALRGTAKALLALALLQLTSGMVNVVLDWPLLAAVAHTGGAAALVVVLTGALVATRPSSESARDAAYNLSQAIR